MMKRNDGFTLVEMMVSIIAGTLATAAVATILLLGIRMNAKTSEIATRDNQVMIGLTVLGNIAKENEIVVDSEETVSDDNNEDSWVVKNADDNDVEYFSFSNGAINVNNMPLIENVQYASIDGPDENTGLLRIILTIDGEKYPLSVRCRTGQIVTMPTETTETELP